MNYKLAVFDMDGTILDTLEDLTDSVNYVLAQHGYPQPSIEAVRGFVGNGIRLLIERAVPQGLESGEIDRIHQEFMEYYKLHCADKTKPYAGIVELIRALRSAGCRTAVVSNKADAAVQELCEQYFPGLFDFALGERPGIARKPAPDSVYEVLKQFGVEQRDAVYIGDSDVDFDTAKNSGLDCISVTWGFRSEAFLREYGATVFADTPEEVAKKILG